MGWRQRGQNKGVPYLRGPVPHLSQGRGSVKIQAVTRFAFITLPTLPKG
jgi:hypothetical protein